ncbi:DUF4942 domain-containing protein [Variovorax sp. EBFNA2]|uniref:DUF4942 domain-containing protein n=1 Tax=Variovorax sp. EBFNA2 TaxID=3342097 RepID=UPI0029C0A761|nr:DUF4942 domain-containing protein [Variovorax boronicumulans]WPG35331.1 DUF4942 domain-containing protein [Variovorax boronicumulans]
MLMQCTDAVLDDGTPFFAPAATDALEPLIGSYEFHRQRIADVSAFLGGDVPRSVMHYFLDGNRNEDRGRHSLEVSAEQLFDQDGAVSALNAAYWSKALQLTDVLDMMPQQRRNEWNEQMRAPRGQKKDWHAVRRERDQWPERFDAAGNYLDPEQQWAMRPLPDFTGDTVRSTLSSLINMRSQFLAERVDGIFRALSGGHVTNVPEGFGRRMIIARILTCYDTVESSRVGYINDLRCVIAKFMGRGEPRYQASDEVVRIARQRRGEWLLIDGGALRIRVYKVGTAHLEVHPDMAWRLNMVLAHLHPLAIPAQFRMKPKKQPKAFRMMGRPLPFAVVEMLTRMRIVRERIPDSFPERHREVRNARAFDFGEYDAAVRAAAEKVLMAVGGTPAVLGKAFDYFQFDYEPGDVLNEIIASGCIPDQKSHQFYPTPGPVARAAVELADVQPGHAVLEPSAGQGALAEHLTAGDLTCIEIAPLHCEILRARGFNVVQADFVLWADAQHPDGARFDRIVMNPPYSEGRWKRHTERAAGLLKPRGVLVAVLPASARGKAYLPGGATHWSEVLENQFEGTTTDVVLMKWEAS